MPLGPWARQEEEVVCEPLVSSTLSLGWTRLLPLRWGGEAPFSLRTSEEVGLELLILFGFTTKTVACLLKLSAGRG